jgi:glyoxylase-like metal-dependent hydrolase (beta-lactamase superfamily II)
MRLSRGPRGPRGAALGVALGAFVVGALGGLGVGGCGSREGAATPRAPTGAKTAATKTTPFGEEEAAPHGTYTRDPVARQVGTYVSIPWGFSTSSYVLEGPDGLVAIDTQFLPSAAEEMIAAAEAATRKQFVLAIVLHANPDKFNGTATFQKHGVKVVTSAQVKALLPSIHEKRLRSFHERYEPDYPNELPAPDVFGDKTTELKVAGLTLKLHVMGAGCSESHVVVEHQGSLFAGDLVASHAHSWLEIGKTDEGL